MRLRGLEPPRGQPPLGPQPSASAIPPQPHNKNRAPFIDKIHMSVTCATSSIRATCGTQSHLLMAAPFRT